MYYLLSLKSFSFWYRKWLEMWFNRQNVSWTMSTLETPKWLEILKEAGPLFGDYLQEALASKLARVLPNNCVLLPDELLSRSSTCYIVHCVTIVPCGTWLTKQMWKTTANTHLLQKTISDVSETLTWMWAKKIKYLLCRKIHISPKHS